MNICFKIIIFIINAKLLICFDSPFPVRLVEATSSNNRYPLIAVVEDSLYLFTNTAIYLINRDNNFTVESTNDFDSKFYVSQLTENILYLSQTQVYFFPNFNKKIIVRSYENGSEVEYDLPLNETISIIDTSYYQRNKVMISGIDYSTNKGFLNMYYRDMSLTSSAHTRGTFNQNALFSCQFFKVVVAVYCISSKNNNIIYSNVYNRIVDQFFEENVIYTLDSQETETISDILIRAGEVGKGLGIALMNPSHTIALFPFTVTSSVMTITSFTKTDQYCVSQYYMKMIAISEDRFLVQGFDDNQGISTCRFYDQQGNRLNIANKDICGENSYVRVALLQDNYVYFTYINNDDSYVYYYQYEAVQCSNTDFIYNSGQPVFITINDLTSPNPSYVEDYSGFTIYEDDSNSLYGTFTEIDNEGNELPFFTFNNVDHFYQTLKYVGMQYGRNIFRYQMHLYINKGKLDFPTNECTITIINNCYSSCGTCIDIGDEIDHKCTSCAENASPLENSMNCYFSPPKGYFLNQDTWTYIKCSDNCYSCQDENNCLICNQGYSLLSSYTKDSNDAVCIPTCELSHSRWYFDENDNFICLGVDSCPSDYSCFISNKRQCLPLSSSNIGQCEVSLPENISLDELFEFLDKNIRHLFETGFIETKSNYTALAYDSSITSNNHSKFDNLTEISIDDCIDIIKKKYNIPDDESILIGQVETPNEDRQTSTPYFSFYTKDGEKIILDEKCNITLSKPIDENDLTLEKDYIIELGEKGIDVFNSKDDFFHDTCYNFSSKNTSMDVILKDRQNHYFQNISICEENCEYSGMNYDLFYATCLCQGVDVGSSDSIGKQVFSLFEDTLISSNYKVIICYNVVFSVETLTNNIGSYCLLGCFVFQLINLTFYLINNKKIFDKYLNEHKGQCGTETSQTHTKEVVYDEKVNKMTRQGSNNNNETKSMINSKADYSNDNLTMKINNSPQLKVTHFIKVGKPYLKKIINKQSNLLKRNIDYNKLDFVTATLTDKRPFHDILIIRVKRFHPIYNCFVEEMNKIRNISIAFFILRISTDLTFNAFFYSDSYISNVYHEGYNFIYEIPKVLLSSLMSIVISFFLQLLETDLHNEEDNTKGKENKKELVNKVKRKNIVIFVIIFMLIFLCWYFITAFCGVYQNSQYNWLYGALTSFGITLFIPFFVAILCSFLRKVSFLYKIKVFFHLERFIESYY